MYLKDFPELADESMPFDKLYDLSEERFKDSVVYARVIQDWDKLLNTKKIMDLEILWYLMKKKNIFLNYHWNLLMNSYLRIHEFIQ